MEIENWETVFKCPYYDECHNTDLYFDNERVLIVNENIECKAPLLRDINGEVMCLMTCSNVDDYKLFVKSKNKRYLLEYIKNIKRRIFNGRKFVRKKTCGDKHVAS